MPVILQPRCRIGVSVTRASVITRAKKDAAISAKIATLSTVATVSSAQNAEAADVDGAVNATVNSVKAAGELLKGAFTGLESFANSASETYQKLSPSISAAVDKAVPVVKQGYSELNKVAGPTISKAVPAIQDSASKLLKESGVDIDTVNKTTTGASKVATEAVGKATPLLTKVFNFLTTSDPQTLGKTGLALVATYYFFPFFLRAAFNSLRGYSGELSPAKAVDFVTGMDSACIVDIRSVKEKSATGVPDVPSSARGRFIELEQASIDRRLRGQLRSADAVETRITALEIQALKRVSKGSTIMLLDKTGGSAAKDTAKELARLGFRKVYVITGGFNGWQASKLQIKAPVPGMQSNVMSNIIGTISTRSINKPKSAAK